MKKKSISCKSVLPLVILDMLEAIGNSRSLALAICLRHKAIHENTELLSTMSHTSYQTADDYFKDAQACALLKKNLFLDEGIDNTAVLEERALVNFLEVELEVSKFEDWRSSLGGTSFEYRSLVNRAAIIAESILGRFPSEDFSQPDLTFTAGSTATLSGLEANVVGKIQSDLYVSPSCAHLLMRQIENCDLLKSNWPSLRPCKHNVFKTVPKDFLKQRIVCPEPLGNMLLQRRIASYIKKRLRKTGINIETQADLHRDLLALMPEVFCTIDQSDASDRISRALIKDILPSDWFDVLDKCRSKYTILPSQEAYPLSKFMTQGNGFTFELETLIFYCISKAAIDNSYPNDVAFVSVFGDDTIVYDHHGETVMDALVLCGLKINFDKSFCKTHFKESCGYDVFDGIPVRPIYLKDFSKGIYGIYELINRITTISRLFGGNVFSCRSFYRAFKRVENLLPENQRFYGPPSFGDTVIHDYTGEKWKTRSLFQCSYIRTLGTKYVRIGRFRRVPSTESGTLIYALCGYDSQGTLIRGAPRIYRSIWCTLHERGTGVGWL